ncbi:hypothetical protein R8Z50_30165 [Longispora sp. K20-0274]|uniref:hypothetical protein n=1 Tax=Longispora sp. K20-0274 TaxID=3088255 RepID=UPI00399A5A5B
MDAEWALGELVVDVDPKVALAQAAAMLRSSGGRPGFMGVDPSNAVRVMVDEDGLVTDVEISAEWLRQVGASGLASAVFVAYANAVRTAMTAIAITAMTRAGTTYTQPRKTNSFPDPRAANGSDASWSTAATWSTLASIDTELDRLAAPSPTSGLTERTVASPSGLFVVRLRGRGIADVRGDARAIAGADVGQLRRDAVRVLRAAAQSAAR